MYTVASRSNDVAPTWQQSCAFLSHCKIWNNVHPEISACSANFFAVQCLSPSMHCSIIASDMSVWMDTECPLQCMSAVDTLPPLDAFTHLATTQDSKAWSFNASHSSTCHSHAFVSWRTIFIYEHSPLYRFLFQNETANSIMLAYEMPVHSSTYIPIWWQHLQIQGKCFQMYILHYQHCHIFGQKKKVAIS